MTRAARLTCLFLVLVLGGCGGTGIPRGVEPVTGFQLQRYLGSWYEIARLDHSFERGLEDVQAHYSLRDDGGVRVVNRGYSPRKGAWQEATGRAYFVGDAETGHLRVSFFGPFHGAYVIFELDRENYQYALVSGPDHSYLWLLARSPDIDEALRERLIARAAEAGFDTGALIFVNHGVASVAPPRY